MFDRTILNIPQRSYSENNIKVTENRAPTDESIRLLKEMEKKVFDNFLGAFTVDTNLVSGNIYFVREIDCTTRYKIVVNINGKEFTNSGKIKGFLFNEQEILKLFCDDVSNFITETILINNEKSIIKDIFNKDYIL